MDAAQIDQLYQRYGPVVYGRCLRLLGNEAEARDTLHDVFLKILEQIDGFRGQAQVSTWIYRIATNACIGRLRKRRPTRGLMEGDLPSARDPERESLWRDLVRKLAQEADERELIVALHYFVDGMTQEEIAGVMGLSRRTIGTVLRTFRSRSRALAEQGEG